MILQVKVFKLNVEFEDFEDGNDQVLVDEFLSKLDLNVKLHHIFIVLHIEVLRVEEGDIVGVISDLVRLDFLFRWPVHILS